MKERNGDTIRGLREEIKDLVREAEYREKEHDLEKEIVMVESRKKQMEIEKDNAQFQERCTQLEARLKDTAYEQLKDILKALVVKLPTLDIKELSVTTKESE